MEAKLNLLGPELKAATGKSGEQVFAGDDEAGGLGSKVKAENLALISRKTLINRTASTRNVYHRFPCSSGKGGMILHCKQLHTGTVLHVPQPEGLPNLVSKLLSREFGV